MSEIEKIKNDSAIALAEINKEKPGIYKEMESPLKDVEFHRKMWEQYVEAAKKSTFQVDQYNKWADEEYAKYHEIEKSLEPFRTKLDELETKRDTIKVEHNRKIQQLLFSGNNIKGQTDVNGFYGFQGLKRGKYLLFARHTVFNDKITWLTVAEVKERENKSFFAFISAVNHQYRSLLDFEV